MDIKSNKVIEGLLALLNKLNEDKIRLKEVYLFGSSLYSEDFNDIDAALVSDDFSGVRFLDMKMIIETLGKYPSVYDIHPFRTEEFYDENNFFAQEILKTGRKIEF